MCYVGRSSSCRVEAACESCRIFNTLEHATIIANLFQILSYLYHLHLVCPHTIETANSIADTAHTSNISSVEVFRAAAGALFSDRRPGGPKVRTRCNFYDFRQLFSKIQFGVCFNILKYIKAHSKPKAE